MGWATQYIIIKNNKLIFKPDRGNAELYYDVEINKEIDVTELKDVIIDISKYKIKNCKGFYWYYGNHLPNWQTYSDEFFEKWDIILEILKDYYYTDTKYTIEKFNKKTKILKLVSIDEED